MKIKKLKKILSGLCAGTICLTMFTASGIAAFAEIIRDSSADSKKPEKSSEFSNEVLTKETVSSDAGAGEEYITRGEWMHTLVSAFDMTVDDESTVEEYFTDISGHEYEADINLAANFGVFDIDSETFVPDENVTREFMAHTMNYCVGFADDTSPAFMDVDEIYYAGDAQVAISRGWLELIDGAFCPDQYVTQNEADIALSDAYQIQVDGEVLEDGEEFVMDSSVIEIEETAVTTLSGTLLTIEGSTVEFAEGDTISFPLQGNKVVRKVVSLYIDEESGVKQAEVEMPEESIVEEMATTGFGYIDYDNIEVLIDGVDLTMEDDAPVVIEQEPYLLRGPSDVPIYGKSISGTVNVPTKKLQFKSKQLNLGGGTLQLSGGISKMTVPYLLDMTLLKVNKAKVGVNADMNLKATLITEMKSCSGEIEFLKIPIVTGGVANIVVTASISISVKGEITITYSCGVDGSVEYTKKNGWRFEKNFHSNGFTIDASIEEKMGIKLAVQLTGLTKKLGEVYFAFGEQGKVHAKVHSDGFCCTDITAFLYAEFGVNFVFPKYKKTWSLINASNSPFHINDHYDNDVKVKSCTYGKTSSTPSYVGSSTSDGGKVSSNGRVIYTGKSGNIKRASGTKKASTWTSNYTNSTQVFKEFTPPAVISSDTKLTEDMTYDYGLKIEADLDLNGHKLTVNGDLNHTNGTVTFNKGTLTVSGDYSSYGWSFPKLYMNYKEDTFIVDGTVSMGRDGGRGDLEAIAGTCEFKGDFYSYYNFNASDLHRTIFSGTKDQIIYCKDTTFNVVEIKNSNSRKLLLENRFLASSGVVCDGDTLTIADSHTVSADNVYVKLSNCAVENLKIEGDCTLGTLNYTGKNITIDGNTTTKGAVYMNGCAWVNNGNLRMDEYSDEFILGGGNLTVNGDLTIGGYYGHFTMDNKKDVVTVTGNLNVQDYNGNLSNGVMYIVGDIYATDRIQCSENHRIVLTGKNDQSLYMKDKESYIKHLKIENSGNRKFILDGYFRCGAIECGEESLNLITNDIPGNVGSLSFGDLYCSELNIEGDVNFYWNNYFNGKAININGSCTLQNWVNYDILDIGSAIMTVKGNMTENEDYYDDEYIKISGGKLIVEGDYTQNSGVLHISTGSLEIAGDSTFNGSIIMDKDDSILKVSGDMDVKLKEYTNLTAGTIELYGNMTSTSGYLRSSGTFKMILAGEKDQALKLDPTRYDDNVGFASLEVKNADKRKLILQNRLSAGDLTCDGKAVNITSNGGAINEMKLRCDMNITGDVVVRGSTSYDTVDLNGNTMTIDGNLYQYGSIIKPSTGSLNVNKNYLMVTEEDSAVYGTSDGILSMTNDGDYVLVKGDFITNTTQKHDKYLTAGTLEIQGNFHQMADGSEYAFPASGSHNVILSGTGKQNIKFDSFDKSHFNILDIQNSKENCTFSPNPCWNKIAGEETTTTTTTTTTTITVTEATTSTIETTTEAKTTTSESEKTETTTVITVITTTTAMTTTTASIVASGECGDDASWSLDENGNLNINGSGEIYSPSEDETMPWGDYSSNIISVEVTDGIISIPSNVFENCTNVIRLIIPKSVTAIAADVFDSCTSLTDVYYYGTEKQWTELVGNSIASSVNVHFDSALKVRGDIDGDNVVNISDATIVLQIYAYSIAGLNLDDYSEEHIIASDVDKNGIVDISDATAILNYYAQSIAALNPSWDTILSK